MYVCMYVCMYVGRYTNAFTSKGVEDRLLNLAQTKNLKPIRIATEIKDFLINNAEMFNQKKKKLQKDEIASSPWFDRECEDGKIGLRKLGSQLKQNPCDQNTRTELNK